MQELQQQIGSQQALQNVMPLLLSYLCNTTRRALRLTCRDLQHVHDSQQVQLNLGLKQLLDSEGRVHTEPIPRLLGRGWPLPQTLTISDANRTCPAASGTQLAPLLRAAGACARALHLPEYIDLRDINDATALADAAPMLLEHLVIPSPLMSEPSYALLLGRLGDRLKVLEITGFGSMGDLSGLSHLSHLTRLQTLRAQISSGYGLMDLGWLAAMTDLRTLALQTDSQVPTRDLSCLSVLTRLTSLEMTSCIPPRQGWHALDPTERGLYAHLATSLVAAVGSMAGSLRELRLPCVHVDAALLAALQHSPLELLQVESICLDAQHGIARGAATAAPRPPASRSALPPALRTLFLKESCTSMSTLAALAPPPRSLQRVAQGGPTYSANLDLLAGASDDIFRLHLDSDLPAVIDNEDADDGIVPSKVPEAAPALMRSAAAFLGCRLVRNGEDGGEWRPLGKLSVEPLNNASNCHDVPLRGPHAPWLCELAPLATIRNVTLAYFELSAGDLAALAASLPALQELLLHCCTWPRAALAELAPLERLQRLELVKPQHHCLAPPAAMAALQELCTSSPSLEEVSLIVRQVQEDGQLVEEAPADADDDDRDSDGGAFGQTNYLYAMQLVAYNLRQGGMDRVRAGARRHETGYDNILLSIELGYQVWLRMGRGKPAASAAATSHAAAWGELSAQFGLFPNGLMS